MSVAIPPAIARHSFIRRYPKNFDIQHIVDSTGPHKEQSHTEKIQKLKKYISTDTSHYLPQFRGPAKYRKEIARNALGKILATTPPAPKGAGKRRKKN